MYVYKKLFLSWIITPLPQLVVYQWVSADLCITIFLLQRHVGIMGSYRGRDFNQDFLVGATHMLTLMYEEALEDRDSDRVKIFEPIIRCCEIVKQGKSEADEEFKDSLQCLNFLNKFFNSSIKGREDFIKLIERDFI